MSICVRYFFGWPIHFQKEVDGFNTSRIHDSLRFTSWPWWFNSTQFFSTWCANENRFLTPDGDFSNISLRWLLSFDNILWAYLNNFSKPKTPWLCIVYCQVLWLWSVEVSFWFQTSVSRLRNFLISLFTLPVKLWGSDMLPHLKVV